jgi:hypothetical protein
MTYRFNAFDVIVGVGLSAIIFGAVLFFVATAGIFVPQPMATAEAMADDLTGHVWLQPALGQAIVERLVLDYRLGQAQAEARSQWHHAMLSYHHAQAQAEDPLGPVVRMAATGPVEHDARVQGVMGHAVVNFTRRGIRSGMLAADRLESPYNQDMIRKAEAQGARLSDAFDAGWQPALGRAIVDTVQRHSQRAAGVQERLGAAIARMTHVDAISVNSREANQEQLAALVLASDRATALSERMQLLAAIESLPDIEAPVPTRAVAWPEIPVSFLIVSVVGLGTIFLTGMLLSAMAREARAQADRAREMSRWVYRTAG